MANISLRNLDENVLIKIKFQAVTNNISMEEEIRTILRIGVEENEKLGDAAIRISSGADYNDGSELQLLKKDVHDAINLKGLTTSQD